MGQLTTSPPQLSIATMTSVYSSALVLALAVFAAVLLIPQPSEAAVSNLCKNTTVRNHDACGAIQGQYKCAVFYSKLPRRTDPSKVRKLAWIGGLPDALRKKAVIESEEIRASFGNLKAEGFWMDKSDTKTFCDQDTAESRCYVAMTNPATRPLDSCEKNIINEEGDLTLGDMLCQNLIKSGWIAPSNPRETKDMTISFQYSFCNSGWKPITDGTSPLVMKEKLCCKTKGDKYRFYRCDGSGFKESNTCKQ